MAAGEYLRLTVGSKAGGDEKFIPIALFIVVASPILLLAEVAAIVLAIAYRDRSVPMVVALILNMTFLYYLKALLWGPSFEGF